MAPTCTLTGSKLTWGPKLQHKVNIEGLKRVVIFRGPKLQHLKT